MTGSTGLALLAAGVVVLFMIAALLPIGARLGARRRRALARLAAEDAEMLAAVLPAGPAAAEISLRRRPPPGGAFGLFPEVSTRNLAAFGAEMRRVAILLCVVLTALTTWSLREVAGIPILLGGLAGLLLAGFVWLLWARWRVGRRLARIDDAVPEAFDMMVRGLRVGLPIGTAIKTAGKDLIGPLGEEFRETADRISLGQPVPDGLYEMAETCQNQSLRFFAAAVSIQIATGGNLADVLQRLAAIARGRQQLRRKIASMTAEAKWSGRFLSVFPIMAVIGLLAINPGYFSEISDKPFFMPMLGVVGVLLVINLLFMRWLVKME